MSETKIRIYRVLRFMDLLLDEARRSKSVDRLYAFYYRCVFVRGDEDKKDAEKYLLTVASAVARGDFDESNLLARAEVELLDSRIDEYGLAPSCLEGISSETIALRVKQLRRYGGDCVSSFDIEFANEIDAQKRMAANHIADRMIKELDRREMGLGTSQPMEIAELEEYLQTLCLLKRMLLHSKGNFESYLVETGKLVGRIKERTKDNLAVPFAQVQGLRAKGLTEREIESILIEPLLAMYESKAGLTNNK